MKNNFLDEDWEQNDTCVVQFVGAHVEFSILFSNQKFVTPWPPQNWTAPSRPC